MRHDPQCCDDFDAEAKCPKCDETDVMLFGFCTCCPGDEATAICDKCGATVTYDVQAPDPDFEYLAGRY